MVPERRQMKIYEIFVSLDGEVNAFHQGCITTFIRLAGCNLRPGCTYCDTQYAMDPDSGTEMPVGEIVAKVKELGGNKVTITGGEPLMQAVELFSLTKKLWHEHFKISVETNGTYLPIGCGVGSWVVDFKLPSSGNYDKMKHDIFVDLTKLDYVKFVIMDENDYLTAIREKNYLQSIGCHANFAFSPMFGPQATPINEIKHKLVEWLIRDKVFDAIVNVQIHKLLGVA